MYAVNDPKHYPDRPVTQENEPEETTDAMDATDRARLDALFSGLAAKSKELPPAKPEAQQNGPEKPTAQKL